MRKFTRISALAVCMCLAFTACGKKEKSKDTKNVQVETESATEPETEEVYKDRKTITYMDAAGGWHFMEVDEDAKPIQLDLSLFEKEGHEMSYEGDGYTYRLGVDVSKYQSDVKWKKVARTGYEFAFIRLGYRGYTKGDIFLDEKYIANIKGATEAGLDTGVYFFSQAINEEEAEEEADFCLKNIQGYDVKMPIVYDPETIYSDDSRTKNISREQYTKNCIAFCEKVKEAGYEPMIYANLIWEAENLDIAKMKNYKIWYADYVKYPQTPYNFNFWQYTDTGVVKGITGNADINIEIIER